MNGTSFASFINKDFNNCIDKVLFPDNLKHVDVTPVTPASLKSSAPMFISHYVITSTSLQYIQVFHQDL